MYPFKVIVIGCNDCIPDLQQVLSDHGTGIETELHDVQSVLSLPAAPADKHLFIVHVNESADLKQVERLSDTHPGQPILVLASPGADNELLLRAVRAGASQVVALPLRPDDLADALARVARQFGFAGSQCKLVVVSGVSGGAGTTTVALNLASAIGSQFHVPTLLTELGLHIGKLAVCLNIKPRLTTLDLLADPEHLDVNLLRESLTAHPDNFQVLAGPYQSVSGGVSQPIPSVLHLLDLARRLANVVIVDMPYSYDELYFAVLSAADQVVLIAEQKIPSIHSLLIVRDALEQKGITARQHLVVNRYSPTIEDLSVTRLRELLRVPELQTISNEYAAIWAATNNGQTLRQQKPSSPAVADIDRLAGSILGAKKPPADAHGFSARFRQMWHTIWNGLPQAVAKPGGTVR